MIGTLGQFVLDIRNLLSGGGDPIPVSIEGAEISIENVSIDNEVEIKNDEGNPIPTVQGFALPPYDSFTLDDPDAPTEITYERDGDTVATVTLTYSEGGGLIGGSIAYPEPEE